MYIYSYIHTRITMYKPRKDYSLNLRGLGGRKMSYTEDILHCNKSFFDKSTCRVKYEPSSNTQPCCSQRNTVQNKLRGGIRAESARGGLELAVETPPILTLWS